MNNAVVSDDDVREGFNDGDAVIVVGGKYAGSDGFIVMFHTVKYTVCLQRQRIDVCLHPAQLHHPRVTVPRYRFLPHGVCLAIDTIVVALNNSTLDQDGSLNAIDHVATEMRRRL
jgi:hypothetical protein